MFVFASQCIERKLRLKVPWYLVSAKDDVVNHILRPQVDDRWNHEEIISASALKGGDLEGPVSIHRPIHVFQGTGNDRQPKF